MTVAEERAYALKLRHPALPVESRGYGLIAQAVFFVLTVAGIAAFYFFTEAAVATAVICIVTAEYLIRARKWFYTGVEAALWIGGLMAALQALPRSGAPEALLLVAAAFALAGLRVRQPLFGGTAAALVATYLEERYDVGTLVALLMATTALFALYRTWKRPSIEWLFIVAAVGLPFVGVAHADTAWQPVTIVLYAAFAAVALVSALLRRHHAMFAAAAAGAGIAGAVAHDLFNPPAELSLAMAGTLLLVASMVVSRALRRRTRGLVLASAERTEMEDGLEILGTLAATPASAGNPPDGRPQDGGGFGGAGATGSY